MAQLIVNRGDAVDGADDGRGDVPRDWPGDWPAGGGGDAWVLGPYTDPATDLQAGLPSDLGLTGNVMDVPFYTAERGEKP